jgi:DNA-binding beta-propeller fold protein YncE
MKLFSPLLRRCLAASLLLAAFATLAANARAQVLVSDFNLDRIVRFEADGSAPTVLVATGSGGLDLPHRSRVGPDGLLYVASAGTDQILRFNATSGAFVDVFAGSGGGLLDYPVDFVFRPDGFLYVSSQLTNSVLRYSVATGARDTGWIAQNNSITGPSGIVFDDAGHLYVAGRFSNNVARFNSATGAHQLTFGSVSSAFGLTLLPDSRLLAASGAGSLVAFTAPDSASPAQSIFASGFNVPVGIALDSVSGTLLTANYGNGSISRHSVSDCAFLGQFVASGGALSGPNYLTVITPSLIPEPSATIFFTGFCTLYVCFFLRSRRPRA